VGQSGFRIDLGIIDPKNPDRYVLGIECDGAAYHSSFSARTRDILRQDVLEKMGWKIYRIWSQDWFVNKDRIIGEIRALVESNK
jgi:very-short-patch-repair endonuclease